MEEVRIDGLRRELKLKEFQFNAIYEFSSSIYSSFQIENIIRIFFSTIMGQTGISRAFLFDKNNELFKRRGFKTTEDDIGLIRKYIDQLDHQWFQLKVEELDDSFSELKELLLCKKIFYLVNISSSNKNKVILGLGLKLNRKELKAEEIEFAFFVSRFALIAVENTFLINRMIETKRMEHEIKIARDIQLSLLPQGVPELENFEISVIYQPINEVGGDYYDILKEHKGRLPVLVADVEGKGLSAALLAASSQAIFHSLNELYFFEPSKFIQKANSLIFDFTKGKRFITLFWMLINDLERTITYVNAGHIEPLLISGQEVISLSRGGMLAGFISEANYEKETVQVHSGDVLVVFTDGVLEVESPEGEELGKDELVRMVQDLRHLPAQEMTDKIFQEILKFSQGKKFRDDFTLVVIKVK